MYRKQVQKFRTRVRTPAISSKFVDEVNRQTGQLFYWFYRLGFYQTQAIEVFVWLLANIASMFEVRIGQMLFRSLTEAMHI